MFDQVVLISTGGSPEFPYFTDIARRNIGLLTIEEALRYAKFPGKVVFFPPEPFIKRPSQKELNDRLIEVIGNASNPIFGITQATAYYYQLPFYSDAIRELFPNAPIIAGGPMFGIDPKILARGKKEAVEIALKKRIVDGVNVGHATPFSNLAFESEKSLEELVRLGDERFQGLYTLSSSGEVIGGGIGEFPKIGRIPYIKKMGRDGITPIIYIVIKDGCYNNCNFCCIYRVSRAITTKLAVNSIKEAVGDVDAALIVLEDSNLPEPKRVGFYRKIFEELDSEDKLIAKWIYMDPSLPADDSYFRELVDFIVKHHIYALHMGRDCVNGEIAERIGSKYLGQIRTQQQLDRERAGIKRLIKELGSKAKKYEKYSIILQYILTPFETEESALQLIGDVEDLEDMATPKVTVHTEINPLNAYHGTQLREDLSDFIINPNSLGPTRWSRDLKGALLMVNAMPLVEARWEEKLDSENYFRLFRAVIDYVYRRNLDPSLPQAFKSLGYTLKAA